MTFGWQYYLDTSAFGGLVDHDTLGRVEATLRLLEGIKSGRVSAYTSVVALEEIERAPVEIQNQIRELLLAVGGRVLDETSESDQFVAELITKEVLSERFRDDARHIAVAVTNDLDAIVSWNFRHMVNPARRREIQSACIRLGYRAIDIISPLEITDGP